MPTTKADEKLIDALIQENRDLRELMRQEYLEHKQEVNALHEFYLFNFTLTPLSG